MQTVVLKKVKTGVSVAFSCQPWYVADLQPTAARSRVTMVSDKGLKHRLYVADKPQVLARTLASALRNHKASDSGSQKSKCPV
ncbi:hypothetical protein [Paracoccus yibinensis]|uniref:hypothetical protein n=1 Tax=Paracoccus TaxID=265 RepID=UPI002796B903|nr:hypothetical protein [Paracoccus sp. WLY502]MDQ1900822.1 hypothetical protein [Paracoccus sp. WLY502]